ncbi:GrpB family protein [Clostridium taeniosporum]|uniref:GrpB family protein n=1 Tax=Clostridium taeniosporum TaxID=394958 RepID=A0A1D7XLV5_9CLOT|nr:GrpB family protein [Clostridium taeniosporum]AOR24332.1 GrpB family protein [Clostridium taeniosporum]
MRTKNIIVLPYDNNWVLEFEKIKSELMLVISDYVIYIEHVGSTSIDGMSAKPIIDIDVVIPDYKYFEKVVERLSTIGYEHEGDLGIKDREVFKYTNKPHLMQHHLYVCPENSKELKRHILFRDYLRKHKEDVIRYSKVKEEAALLYPTDIDSYIKYKSPCIEEIYIKCGL